MASSKGRRLHRRRSRAELHLHRTNASGDRFHHRHTAGESKPPSLYKALFEISIDRADFVSRLFSRPRPAALGSTASVGEIFKRFEGVPPTNGQYEGNSALVRDRLLGAHGLPLSQTDLEDIDRALRAFAADGPDIQFWGTRTIHGIRPSYRWLMTAADSTGQSRSFLATEEDFRFVKELQEKNLVVPVVGDFSGSGAIRRVGDYVRQHADVVHAFYGSNVGVYPEHATDACVLRESCGAARRAGCVVHRKRQRAVAGLEGQNLRAGAKMITQAIRRGSARIPCLGSPVAG